MGVSKPNPIRVLLFNGLPVQKTFVCPLKANRLVALSRQDKLQGKFEQVSQIKF